MLTHPYLTYSSFGMKPSYQEATASEVEYSPLDFQPIDAPSCMPAGSWYQYQPLTRGLKPWPMPAACDREL